MWNCSKKTDLSQNELKKDDSRLIIDEMTPKSSFGYYKMCNYAKRADLRKNRNWRKNRNCERTETDDFPLVPRIDLQMQFFLLYVLTTLNV